MENREKKVLVIGVIGADVHAVGNKILYHAFTEAGFEVVNLGVMSPRRSISPQRSNPTQMPSSSPPCTVRASWTAAVCAKSATRPV